MLFKPQTPGAVQIVVGVSAEGDHGLGAGDAWNLGYSLGDDVGQALEVGDTDHDDEIVGSCDRVSLGDTIYREHGLGGFLHALPLRPDQHYCRYHADSLKPSPQQPEVFRAALLYSKRHPARERIVGRTFLVLHGPSLDGDFGGLVELAGYKAADLDHRHLLGFEARYGLALGLALGSRVEDDLDLDSRLGHLTVVLDGNCEGRLVRPSQDNVSVRVQWLPCDSHSRYPHPVQGVRVAPCSARYGGRVETERPVIHKGLWFLEVGLVACLARSLQGMLDGRDVVVRDDAVARPVVLDGRRELPGEPARIPRSRLHELVCGLGSYAQRCNDVVMVVLELWRYLLLPQSL